MGYGDEPLYWGSDPTAEKRLGQAIEATALFFAGRHLQDYAEQVFDSSGEHARSMLMEVLIPTGIAEEDVNADQVLTRIGRRIGSLGSAMANTPKPKGLRGAAVDGVAATTKEVTMKKAQYIYRGARYVVAAPPPTPSDAISPEQKQQICQYTQILVDGTQSIRDWLGQYGIQDTGLDVALDIYEEVNEASDKAVGGCAVKTSAVLRRTMARVAADLPPPTPEAQEGLNAVLAKIKATVDATEGVKRALMTIGLEDVEKSMNEAKQYMSELYKAIEMGGADAISKFQAKQQTT